MNPRLAGTLTIIGAALYALGVVVAVLMLAIQGEGSTWQTVLTITSSASAPLLGGVAALQLASDLA